ncbi:MAG: alpha/beta fold hydrolase, partial [Panacibacter sp.]
HKLKPNNQARIIWANDSLKQKTEYAIVYLHGYSASQEEGKPIHTNIAKEFGCNLYLTRLAEHGIDTIDPMINLTAEEYWESAKKALAIGKQLGNKVILMGTSTGGTNALQLAAAFPNDITALVLMSPNIAINNSNAYLLNNHWGFQLAKLITGDDYVSSKDQRPIFKEYWYSHYPLQSTVQLQEMLETTMTKETFEKVKQPLLMLYYYKDEIHQDSVVSVPAMLNMFSQLGSKTKIKQAVPNAGDHVIGSYIKSNDLLSVQNAIEKFMQKTLGLQRVHENAITNSFVPEVK